jgi:hypothetical protein
VSVWAVVSLHEPAEAAALGLPEGGPGITPAQLPTSSDLAAEAARDASEGTHGG